MTKESEKYLDLTVLQVINRLRKILEHTSDEREGVWLELVHPENLTWEGNRDQSSLPPQIGRVVRLMYNCHHSSVLPEGILLDFAASYPIHGICYAKFGIGALRVLKNGTVVVDCSKLETPKGGIQSMLPNSFSEKIINP